MENINIILLKIEKKVNIYFKVTENIYKCNFS